MSDTSRQTAGRWEIRFGTCVIASMINFHRDGEHMMVDGAGGGGMRLAVHMFKGDATKSAAWKSHKVQSLHITSAYVFGLAERDSLPVVYDKSCWSDCQIADDCSGTGMMQLIHKQLRSAGCPALDLVDVGCRDSFRLVISCGDDGPDQKVFRRLMLEKYRCSPYVLCSGFSCILHHQCLGVKRVLFLTDLLCTRYAAGNILYYSGCVKFQICCDPNRLPCSVPLSSFCIQINLLIPFLHLARSNAWTPVGGGTVMIAKTPCERLGDSIYVPLCGMCSRLHRRKKPLMFMVLLTSPGMTSTLTSTSPTMRKWDAGLAMHLAA